MVSSARSILRAPSASVPDANIRYRQTSILALVLRFARNHSTASAITTAPPARDAYITVLRAHSSIAKGRPTIELNTGRADRYTDNELTMSWNWNTDFCPRDSPAAI